MTERERCNAIGLGAVMTDMRAAPLDAGQRLLRAAMLGAEPDEDEITVSVRLRWGQWGWNAHMLDRAGGGNPNE